MRVLAIDPGSEQSAYVLLDGERVETHGILPNTDLRAHLVYDDDMPQHVVIEWIASYGMPVGSEVFDTARWVGRFEEALKARKGVRSVDLVLRRDVKLHLCQSARAKDSNVRQALLDRFGGDKAAKGTKAAPGPLYGLRADEWQALALAVTFYDQRVTQVEVL